MDMGKCTSYILYIKQNPTPYKETTISQRNIIYSPPSFSKNKEEKMAINRVLDLI
jgi:hypothetical protein